MMIRTLFALFLALSIAVGGGAFAADAPQSLLSNGDFETITNGKPADWPLSNGATWETEGGNHFLRLASHKPGEAVMVLRTIEIPQAVGALELSFKARYQNIHRGKRPWFDGRIILNFKDGDGDDLSPSPKPPAFTGTSAQWKAHVEKFRVPEGAKTLELMFTLFQAESGQLDFDDVTLVPIPVEVIAAEEAAAAAKEAARIALLPKPKPQEPIPTADQLPPELHVVGNQLQTAKGRPVWLQGVAVPSLEWSAGGEHILESINVAIHQWKANCIRLPIRENFWAGHGPYQTDGGMKYRQLVDDAVNLCGANGVYIAIDLHDFRAPTEAHVAFWQAVAPRYKNNPAVLYELFNEPHDISWQVWHDGGVVTNQKKPGKVAAENKQKLKGFTTVGMQKLVDTIRAAGAKNILIAGGLDWSYDLSGILHGYALKDPGGDGIIYSAHVYPWKTDWQNKFVCVAAKYPLFLGEVGADTRKMDFIPADQQEDPYTWAPDMLGLIQKYKLNWTAWCFHPKSTPRVIEDWSYKPTPFWGEFVKEALAGKQFEMKKMR